MWLRVSLTALIALGAYSFFASRPISHQPGVLAPDEPRQVPVADEETIRYRGYDLTPVAHFEVEARVLGKKRYRDDRTARLAPYDLAVGWGPMSDSSILDQLLIIQAQRAYTWRYEHPPIPPKQIVLHSTNMHLIPATSAVESALLRVKEGHLVRLNGRLVHVLSRDGSRWRTSTSRADAGVGACEIVWVESLEVVGT